MSGAGEQIKDKPWLLPVGVGATALTGGMLAPMLAGSAAAAGAGAVAAGAGMGGGTAASLMGAGAGSGLAASLLGPTAITPAVTGALGAFPMAAPGVGASLFGAGSTVGPLALDAMGAAGGTGMSLNAALAGKMGMDLLNQQNPSQPPPMARPQQEQMPLSPLPQFNSAINGMTTGGLELVRRRRGV